MTGELEMLWIKNISEYMEGGALNRLTGCPLGSGEKCQSEPWREVCQEYVKTPSDDSRVDRISGAGNLSLSHLFLLSMARWRDEWFS